MNSPFTVNCDLDGPSHTSGLFIRMNKRLVWPTIDKRMMSTILLFYTIIASLRISNASSSLTRTPHTNLHPTCNRKHIISDDRYRTTLSILQRIRAGAIMEMTDSDDEEDVQLIDDEEEDDEETTTVAAQEDTTTQSDISVEETNSPTLSKPASTTTVGPVKVILRTTMASPLIDQSIEFTASRTRTVASLKQAVSRQFRGRPPQSMITLLYRGQVLQDDTLVSELIQEDDMDDTQADEEKDTETPEEEEDSLKQLHIVVDIIPPIDPKFGTDLKQRLPTLTAQELLDAYVANLAMMHQNSMDIMHPMGGGTSSTHQDHDGISPDTTTTLQSVAMRSHALTLKQIILQSLSEDVKKVLLGSSPEGEEDEGDNVQETQSGYTSMGDSVLLRQSIRGKLRKKRGGASMNVKRALQTQLNIDWPSTIRNFLLFLFFGYFGGRNAFSRTVMLLGAPACFILQARPVKIFMKQIFYAIGEPPSIILSLLPAPQQAIMSYHYNEAIVQLYGEGSGNDLIGSDEREDGEEEDDDDDDDDDNMPEEPGEELEEEEVDDADDDEEDLDQDDDDE